MERSKKTNPGFNRVIIESAGLETGSYTIELRAGRKIAKTDISIN